MPKKKTAKKKAPKKATTLTRDMARTITIDPVRLVLEQEVEIYSQMVAQRKRAKPKVPADITAAAELGAEAERKLANYDKAPEPGRVVIGFMPAEKVTEFEIESEEANLLASRDRVAWKKASARLDREIARWTIVDVTGFEVDGEPLEFSTELDTFEGEKVRLASKSVVAYLERRRLLRAIRWKAWPYNTLDAEKKSR